jgi:hypothetical protein
MRQPSFRHYVRARELKAAGMVWTEVLAEDADDWRHPAFFRAFGKSR